MRIKESGKDSSNWWALWFETSSGYDDDYVRNQLVFYGFGRYYYINFDKVWIKPLKHLHEYKYSTGPDTFTEGSYTVTVPRKWGISLSDNNFLRVFYGVQCDGETWQDKFTDRKKSWFLPWTSWHHTYHHLLNLDGSFWKDVTRSSKLGDREMNSWDWKEYQDKTMFEFKDYDGERIFATVTVEERRWDKGEGKFQWLKYFSKPNIVRSLDIEFSSEVGPKKGSWKGGTIGHSCDIVIGETRRDTFKRYCSEQNLTYLGELSKDEVIEYQENLKKEREKRYQKMLEERAENAQQI